MKDERVEKDGRKERRQGDKYKRSKEGRKERMQDWTREGSEGRGQERM